MSSSRETPAIPGNATNVEAAHSSRDTGSEALARGLSGRHIQFIAIGGTIGVGLFLGSARAIQNAGPGLILSYALGGVVVFYILRALGEPLTYRPVAGAFIAHAEEFVGPFAAFAAGCSYWFLWVVTTMAETTAIGIYVHYWLPDVPQWMTALVALAMLYAANLIAVRIFGELEFWFALIKIAAILVLIAGGLLVIAFDLGELGATASFSNLWSHGGLLPFGAISVMLTLQIVMFAYTGVELVGVAAGETQNPVTVLPRATNSIILRMLIFYIGALIVIMSLVPWNQLDPTISPFVVVFEKLGIRGAADVISIVVISAAASSCNSGIYSTGRMLHSLALGGRAPASLMRLSSRQVPIRAINFSAAFMLIGVGLNYLVPDDVFVWVTSTVLIGSLWTWSTIMLAHLGYRRAVRAGRAAAVDFRMPGAPFANWIVLAFLAGVGAMLWLDPQTRVALYVAPVWFACLAIGYRRCKTCTQVLSKPIAAHADERK